LVIEGLQQFEVLRDRAVSVVAELFWETHGAAFEQSGVHDREDCQKDVAFCVDCLQLVLELGAPQPLVDYLHWLRSTLTARGVPETYVPQMLDLLGEYFARRMTRPHGAELVAALQAARAAFLAMMPPFGPARSPDGWPETARFEAHLLAGRQREVLAIVNGLLDSGRSLVEVEQHLVRPALYHIGDCWQANQISVAGEHMATAMAQLAMTVSLLRARPTSAPSGRRVLLACVSGNHHTLGLRMVADAFMLGGWNVQYLGADVPTSAIVAHAGEQTADLVGLSLSFPHQLRAARHTITRLTERLGTARPPVMIGGLGINRFKRMAELVGADAWCEDAPGAVALANQLVGVGG